MSNFPREKAVRWQNEAKSQQSFRNNFRSFEDNNRQHESSRQLMAAAQSDEAPSVAREGITNTFQKSKRRASMINGNLLGLAHRMSQFDLDSDSDTDDDEGKDNVAGGEVDLDPKFESKFAPFEMRCLALVAHNHMKPAMKNFVLANKNLLKKFRLTGTNTTMTMLREVFGEDPSVEYGPTCTSGPLGGDAELVAVMCTENLGGCVFFQDPMSAHPHTADIECLSRQANVHNVLMMPNPATAFAVMTTFRIALKEGRSELIPSFFNTLESPSVAEYKIRQAKVVEANK